MPETTPITPSEIDPKRRYLCRHIFTEGHRCGSPALRGQNLCYNHNRSRREAGISGKSGTFPMPRIDDRASIQLALYEVLSRLAGGDIEYKRGSILLYGLQIASSNLPQHARTNAEQQPQVEEITSDYRLGDLAPILEIPDPAALTSAHEPVDEGVIPKPDPQWPTNVVIPRAGPQPPTKVVIPSAAKSPRIPPEPPRTSEDTQPLPAPMWTPASHPHPETFSPLHTVPPPQPITLAAVQAVAAKPHHPQKPRTFHGSLTRLLLTNALQ